MLTSSVLSIQPHILALKLCQNHAGSYYRSSIVRLKYSENSHGSLKGV